MKLSNFFQGTFSRWLFRTRYPRAKEIRHFLYKWQIFATFDQNKCLRQIKSPTSLYTCVIISEIASDKITMILSVIYDTFLRCKMYIRLPSLLSCVMRVFHSKHWQWQNIHVLLSPKKKYLM